METKGKVLAIDLGEKRIGLAISDATRLIAVAHSVMQRKSRREDYERYAQLIAEQGITLVVMGLPIPLNGVEGQRAAWVRDYTAELQQYIPVPVEFWDESLSTKQAEANLKERGRSGKRRRDQIDAHAAAVFLQEYLDVHGVDE
jgi:putative Holliday junction resolvase